MAKIKINNLDQLEDLVLNLKISKIDKYLIFKNVLKSFPIIFIDVVTDDSELLNGIEDKDKNLIPKMLKIVYEIRADPTANKYSGMSVIRNGTKNETEANINIDFTE